MADSAASSTSRSSAPATTKRRTRAASSDANQRPTRTAFALERADEARDAVTPDSGEDNGNRSGLFADDDAHDAPHAPSFDPRQGTLAGFELPAEAFASMSGEAQAATIEQPAALAEPEMPVGLEIATGEAVTAKLAFEAAPPSPIAPIAPIAPAAAATAPTAVPTAQAAPAVSQPSQAATPIDAAPERAAPAAPGRPANPSPARRQAPARAPENAPHNDRAAALSAAAFAEAMAAMQGTLAEERRAAQERWRRTKRMLSLATVAALVLAGLSIVQTVVLLHLAREGAAAQQRTEALLLNQQTTLAALAEAASGAFANVRAIANAAASPPPDSQATHPDAPPRTVHAKPLPAHKTKEKAHAQPTH